MKSSIRARVKAGMLAASLVVAQIILPVQSAFAFSPISTPTDGKITICHSTQPNPSNGQGTGPEGNPYIQETVSLSAVDGNGNNDHSSHTGVAEGEQSHVYSAGDKSWGDIIPAYEGFAGLNWNLAGQVIYFNECTIPAKDATAQIAVSDPTCTSNSVASVNMAETANATTTLPLDQSVGVHEATFTATAGHLFADGSNTSIVEYEILPQLTGEDCDEDLPVQLPLPSGIADVCGTGNDVVPTPQDGDRYSIVSDTTWVQDGDDTVKTVRTITYQTEDGYVFTPSEGWVLSENNTRATYTFTDWGTKCPVIEPCTSTTSTIVSKYEDFADYDDTRDTGHTEFTKDGLHIWTEGATSTDKVAWYNELTPYDFSDIGTPSIDYVNTAGGKPGMQILFDKDGNGTQDAILVGEPGFYEGRWWSNTAGLGVPAGDGYNSSASLQEYLDANPMAQVVGVGFSLGSGVKGDGLLKSVTFGCQTWVFKKAERVPTQCTVSDNVYSKAWEFDEYTYPEADFGGSYNFEPSGLYINTPTTDSYVFGMIDAGNTPLADVDAMSYSVLRQSKSEGFAGTLPAYILYVDTNGLSVAGGKTYFFYEPYYNDNTKAAVEGSFQKWDAIDGGDAKWYVQSTGQALRSWSSLVTQYEDAVVIGYGFNQGQDNPFTYTAIQDIEFDCAVTSFTNEGTGGSGGTGDTPTTPVTPVVPTLPVGGQESVLPAELPMTGANGSVLSTWVALLAAVLTYGAVYFLQPKRRAED